MGIFHAATVTPSKAEIIASWIPTCPWGPSTSDEIDVIGSYRFDDPDGRVGMEIHLVNAGEVLMQVPFTYRDEPLAELESALVAEMEHSVLGTRWVYDAVRDPLFAVMLAAVSMTGQGEALGMAQYDGRWYIAPTKIRIHGGGWDLQRVPVDGFELVSDESSGTLLRNDRFELTMFRRPVAGLAPAIGLRASWDGLVEPVVVSEIREL